MSSLSLRQAEAFNAIAWCINNKIKNEKADEMEFSDHKFMIEPYLDDTPRQAIIKCAQIGWSTLAIIRSFHLAHFAGANIIHTFPSRNMSKDFVIPKVNPIIANNPFIQSIIATDSLTLKEVKTPMGNRFIYYRGSYEQNEAVSISANILIEDEYDRSDVKVLETYRSRLDDSLRDRPELGWEWQFSNPTIPGKGVDKLYQESTQKQWVVKCRRCNKEQVPTWPDSINLETKQKICIKCHNELDRENIRDGRWIAFHPDREVAGYHISQMIVPWIPASKIIADSKRSAEVFHNFTLGLPYIEKDSALSREAIIKCLAPGYNSMTNVAMGVDNGIKKHYVIGNKMGIFKIGVSDDWADIERLRSQYGATMVIDALPYPNVPRQFAEKYPGKVYLHYYQQDKKNLGMVYWDHAESMVKTDRTKMFDFLVAEINAGDLRFNMTAPELDAYIYHWLQLYRTVEQDRFGIFVSRWKKIDNQPDHYAHATLLWRVALEQTIDSGGIIDTAERAPTRTRRGFEATPDNKVGALDLQEVAERNAMPPGRDWKTI